MIFVSILLAIFAVISRSHLVSQPRGAAYSHPSYPLRILSVERSVTGLIVVGQGQIVQPSEHDSGSAHTIRYLRASHSILGGVWVSAADTELSAAADERASVLGDSIYTAFVLQEATRLVNSTEKGRQDAWDNALIM